MSYLKLERVSKTFGKRKILDDLSFEMQRGETLVVFGPSGAGKTTLLRAISGIMDPDAGDIWLNGKSVMDQGPETRGVAMAFQNFALYPHMTATENIASPLRSRGVPKSEIQSKVEDVAKLLRIDHVLSHFPRQLSNGQKQRTSLARSLVHNPSMLLLDDPLRNVDAKVRYEMRQELPRLFKRFQTTVIYVTQDYKEAMALGDRVGVLLDGKFRQLDTPSNVYRNPYNTRVANLFGDPPVNLLPVRSSKLPDGSLSINLAGHLMTMTADTAPEWAGRDYLIGLRPEHIGLHTTAQPGAMPVELEAVTPFNVRNVMLLRAPDGTEILASTPENHPLTQVRGQQRVWASIDLQRALVFDRQTGDKI